MVRRLATIGARLIPVLAYVSVTAGCGGDASSTVTLPPPPPPPGPAVSGTVFMPDGRVALRNPSLLERLASLAVQEVLALTGNVSPVGRNETVRLEHRRGDGVTQQLATTVTNDQGQYRFSLPSGTSEDTCSFIVSVGDAGAGTLTRAFVFSTSKPVDIDFASEAAVRLIFDQVLTRGVDLCLYRASDIEEIVDLIRRSPGSVSGENAAQLNRNAYNAAKSDDTVVQKVTSVAGAPSPTRRPTFTETPTRTFTPSPASTPTVTPTFTKLPSNTPQPSPTVTHTVPTATATQTRPVPSPPTATATETTPPTPTPTETATEEGTVAPTATETPPPTGTQVPTETPAARPPQIAIGSVPGAAGTQVTVSIFLTTNGQNVLTIAPLVFQFETGVLTFNSCASKVPSKTADTGAPSAGQVVVILRDPIPGGEPGAIPDGAVIDCTFAINAEATPGTTTLTFVRATAAVLADEELTDVEATGTNGSVTIVPPPTPTVPPVSTATPPPLPTATQPEPTALTPEATPTELPPTAAPTAAEPTVTLTAPLPPTTPTEPPPTQTATEEVTTTPTAPLPAATPTAPEPTVTPTEGTAVPQIAIGSASGAPGTQVDIPILLMTNGLNPMALALVMDFEIPVLTFDRCAKTPTVSSGKSANAVLPFPGRVSVVLSGDLVTPLPDGNMLTCTFAIAAGAPAGPSALTFQSGAVSDDQFNNYDASGTSGSVTVS